MRDGLIDHPGLLCRDGSPIIVTRLAKHSGRLAHVSCLLVKSRGLFIVLAATEHLGGPPQLADPLVGLDGLSVRARVAEIADGFFPGRCGPKEFGDIVNEIRGIAEERGRDPDTIEFGKGIYVRVDSNRERGVRAVRTAIEQYGQGRYDVEGMVKNYAVVGPPEECAERLSAYLGSDAPHVLLELHAISLDTDDLKSLAEVAALVKKG